MFGLLAVLLVVAPPHFRAAPGWHVGYTRAHACVGVSASRCVSASGWASTVRYRDCPDCVPPHRALAHLPPDGIVIQLSNSRERPPRAPWGNGRRGSGARTYREAAARASLGALGTRSGSFAADESSTTSGSGSAGFIRHRASSHARTPSCGRPPSRALGAGASSSNAASSARGGARARPRSASSGRASARRGARPAAS